ncbi:MAG: ROK family transcriptional regulator, partial [Spirochaetales bacterium]
KAEPLRSTDIRERNEKLVLQLIHQEQQISQSEIAIRTGLKPPTVFRIFTLLEKSGLILPVSLNKPLEKAQEERTKGKKGRKPVAYRINPEAYYILGIDWTRTPTLVVVDFSGEVSYSLSREFPPRVDAEGSLRIIQEMIQKALIEKQIPSSKVMGLGIGLPGRVDIQQGSILNYPRIPGMVNFPIRERIEAAFSIPVHVHNNTSVLALSEYRYGKAKGLASFLTVLIRAGVGGAFVQGGVPFANNQKTAVEIGHLGIDPKGPLCYCGQKGCLETYLSEDVILQDLQKSLGVQKDLESLLEKKDPKTLSLLQKKARILCRAVQSLSNVFSPDAILIITRIQALSDLLVQSLEKSLCSSFPKALPIIPSHYKPPLAAKAATDLVLDAFFQV